MRSARNATRTTAVARAGDAIPRMLAAISRPRARRSASAYSATPCAAPQSCRSCSDSPRAPTTLLLRDPYAGDERNHDADSHQPINHVHVPEATHRAIQLVDLAATRKLRRVVVRRDEPQALASQRSEGRERRQQGRSDGCSRHRTMYPRRATFHSPNPGTRDAGRRARTCS